MFVSQNQAQQLERKKMKRHAGEMPHALTSKEKKKKKLVHVVTFLNKIWLNEKTN